MAEPGFVSYVANQIAPPGSIRRTPLPTALSTNVRILIAASLAFVVGLAWNTAIQSAIQQYLPQNAKAAVLVRLGYALLLTVIAVIIVVYFLGVSFTPFLGPPSALGTTTTTK